MPRKLSDQQFCGWCGGKVAYKAEWMSQCTACGHQRYFDPNPCSNVIVTSGDKVLMLERAIEPMKGKYDFPGGYMVIPDSSMEAAAYRELQEEVGLTPADVTPLRYLSSYSVQPYVDRGIENHNVSFYYQAELKNPNQALRLDKENTSIRWVTKADLPNIDFAWDSDRRMLHEFFGVKL